MIRRGRRGRGQAMVEFAIVFPFVVLVFFALFDVARLMFVQISLDAACATATRRLAMNHPETTEGSVYKAMTWAAPGVEIPPQAMAVRTLEGPGGRPWVEVRMSVEQQVISAFYATSSYRLTLRSEARAPLQVEPYGGTVHLP